MRRPPAFDYTTVGHVTVDVLADGSRRPGGSAFYSALQAARLGQRTLILTQGSPEEIERLIAPYREELELQVLPAPATTTLATSAPLATSTALATNVDGGGEQRTQHVLAWAGPIVEVTVDTAVLHLAPVARETPGSWRGRADFAGLTPQGLARAWDEEKLGGVHYSVAEEQHRAVGTAPGEAHREMRAAPDQAQGEMRSVPVGPEALACRCDALVLSEHERASCAELISAAREQGAVVAITAGAQPTVILTPGSGVEVQIAVPPIERPREDLGAGDVFAAAFFIALAEGRTPARATAFANAAAAVRVSGAGADAIGDRETVEARLRHTVPVTGREPSARA